MKIAKNVDKVKLEEHMFALWAVSEELRAQSQPIEIVMVDMQKVVVALKIGLDKLQIQRLLEKPISNNVSPLYKVKVNYEIKQMTLTRARAELASKKG